MAEKHGVVETGGAESGAVDTRASSERTELNQLSLTRGKFFKCVEAGAIHEFQVTSVLPKVARWVRRSAERMAPIAAFMKTRPGRG